ncbi:MAG: hypothetical protein JW821_17965 [Deltaproteobacteria bacterium]|nr:hypothetical protein [Deltaproteobacteria bacterium]
MPAPQASVMTQQAQNNFRSKNIELPMDWSDPGDQYDDAFQEGEKQVAPTPMCLFKEATQNKYHVDSATTIGQGHADYIEGVCGAICGAIDKWMKMTVVAKVVINGPVGVVSPGSFLGPPLMPLILATAPMDTAQKAKYSNAIANAFSTLWQAWHMGLTGQLSYPAFAAFPGPVTPPTPCVPMPLVAFSSPAESGLSPSTLKSTMEGFLADPQALHASDLFDAVAKAFNSVFQTFKSSTMVQNVLGTGQVPSFKPPFSPVGPVVGGTSIPAPVVLS